MYGDAKMKPNPSCPDQRQHINLSHYAFDVVRNDSINFLEILNVSGFINIIVENSKVDSFDDLSIMEEKRIIDELSDCSKSGSKIRPTESEQKTIKKIADAHRYQVLHSYKKYPKDNVLKIRLNNNLYNELYPSRSDWYGKEYGLSQGEYIKALVEEYARKTYYERESVFFKERIEELNRYISDSDNEKRILVITMKNGEKWYCKPYRLSEEYETFCHYLIGLFAKEGTTEYTIFSIRLSRIAGIKLRGQSLGSGKITQKERKEIETRIKESSIPYIKATPIQYTVILTSLGMLMYDYNFSQRPIYETVNKNPDGTYTMKLSATERQMKNYFFAFGKEAVIQDSEEIRDWMKEKFANAENAYST